MVLHYFKGYSFYFIFLALKIVQILSSCVTGHYPTHSNCSRGNCSHHKCHRRKAQTQENNMLSLLLLPEMFLYGRSQGSHEYSRSQEGAHSIFSNERTFQARHCGLWLQPAAHAVLTAKKQAKLFTDSFLTSLAKLSLNPSSYCHHV